MKTQTNDDIEMEKVDVQSNNECHEETSVSFENAKEDVDDNLKDAEEEEKEYIENDPVARNQFNYNQSTCFGDDHPEIGIEENTVEPVQVAPGQGKIPRSILYEEDFEVKAFPCLFPDGKNGKDQQRKVKISNQDYFVQRILNKDKRCGGCPPYVFMAAGHTELNQLQRNQDLSFQRGLEKVRPDGSCVYTRHAQ